MMKQTFSLVPKLCLGTQVGKLCFTFPPKDEDREAELRKREFPSRAWERGKASLLALRAGGVIRTKEPVMVRMTYLLLVLLLGGMVAASPGYAQTADGPAAAGAATAASAATPEPEFLKTFPRPPDQPASLLAPPPPLGPPPPDLERPYFQQDPLLDPPWLGLIGLFADVDVGILKPHLINQLRNTVTFPDGSSTTVGVNPST